MKEALNISLNLEKMPSVEKNNICNCGREIPHRFNSTIKAKLCPSCTLLEATRKPRKGKSSTISLKTNRTPLKKLKPKNASYWMKQADMWFSRYVRLVNCYVVDGEPFCFDIITGKLYHSKNLDCGHNWSRIYKMTRYNPDNCRPQSRSSNRFRGEADKLVFRNNLAKEIGEDKMNWLDNNYHLFCPCGSEELKKLAEEFKEKVNLILIEKQVRKWW
jgi:hypothetical protein